MFSKTCKYAINAMIYVASLPIGNERASLKDISKAINSPEAFTAKILQALVRDDLLISVKGPHGGFSINGKASEIYLAQIVDSIDGNLLFTGCALGLKKCAEEHPCAVHYKFKAIREHLTGMLHSTNLTDMADRVNNGISFLKY
ncbi:transcriptional regulator, BadM/Rrf2 family [Indibacter alkaliphilus LW1]|uniref:Transcriptional regulator, BadM/Rrf2 family n=1 Tax=Indibacter alkaliphilus (strain CCUG 57479 / KCTC 22604 / LW1) TaxID=1189612 RepID=S2E3S2_INDAL|nr:Rrf2 family transcriptional regulator [Indibacter alkaliphilus]EOZ96863.1 transcriptional regulator, BadM/Rrf2 family [Indibacter alkaliphilus LW1]